MSTLLDENAVITSLERAFQSAGFDIVSKCTTSECGVDLHARKGTSEWMIEAKGETSSKKATAHFGKGFDSSQVHVHVSVAIHQAMSLRHSYPNSRIGIALVDEPRHRKKIEAVGDALTRLNIEVLWVRRDGTVVLPSVL